MLCALGQIPEHLNRGFGIGFECSGVVVKKGDDVNNVEIGDFVYANAPHAFSSYVTVAEGLWSKIPACIICMHPHKHAHAHGTRTIHRLSKCKNGDFSTFISI